jgi:diphosphomevalonate decarboxylase
MKATSRAFSNIALVKYWGKNDDRLRLPVNSSVSIGLDKIFTDTTVEVDKEITRDEIEIDGDSFSQKETKRVIDHLNLIRKHAANSTFAKVKTKNNFPKGIGAASSASGFAALTMAAAAAYGLQLSPKHLSILARQGSGSASRSISGGVSVWHKGTSDETSYAENIALPQNWDLRVLLILVGDITQKKVGSTEGMELASTSPYFSQAVIEGEENAKKIQKILQEKDWIGFGQVIEAECYRLHMLCMTSVPSILYWNGITVEIFQKLYTLREQGVVGYFTVDAGPHVHVICQKKDCTIISKKLKAVQGIKQVMECGVSPSAYLKDEHLF